MNQYRGTGRRKTSVARVRLIPGGQGVVINGKAMTEYFSHFCVGAEINVKIQTPTHHNGKYDDGLYH